MDIEHSEDPLDDLTGTELMELAMLAFLQMYDDEVIPKRILLENIIEWFRTITDESPYDVEIHQMMPLSKREH